MNKFLMILGTLRSQYEYLTKYFTNSEWVVLRLKITYLL